jgi:GH24 family phage-related lysozyme (muramidase)
MQPPMTIDDNGLSHLEAFETCSLTAYWDANGWALGYGQHNPTFNEQSICTLDQAKEWIQKTTDAISNRLSELITVNLNQGQFNAMVIFAYNIGVNAFACSHLLSRLNSRDFASVPSEIGRWIYSNGVIDKGLLARRKNEIALWTQASETQNQTQTNTVSTQETN